MSWRLRSDTETAAGGLDYLISTLANSFQGTLSRMVPSLVLKDLSQNSRASELASLMMASSMTTRKKKGRRRRVSQSLNRPNDDSLGRTFIKHLALEDRFERGTLAGVMLQARPDKLRESRRAVVGHGRALLLLHNIAEHVCRDHINKKTGYFRTKERARCALSRAGDGRRGTKPATVSKSLSS